MVTPDGLVIGLDYHLVPLPWHTLCGNKQGMPLHLDSLGLHSLTPRRERYVYPPLQKPDPLVHMENNFSSIFKVLTRVVQFSNTWNSSCPRLLIPVLFTLSFLIAS